MAATPEFGEPFEHVTAVISTPVVEPNQPPPQRPSTPTRGTLGLALLWLVVAVEMANAIWSSAIGSGAGSPKEFPLGWVGIAIIGVAGVGVAAFMLIRGHLTNDQAIWSLAVLAALVAPAVGALANTGLARTPNVVVTSPPVAISLALGGLGLALGLSDAEPARVRRHLFALVSVVSWLNVAAVAARYQVGRPAFTSTIQGPDQLDAILTNPFSSVGRLSGLFGLPDLLGVTMAVALAFQVRYLAHLASTGRRWTAALLAVVGALPTAGLLWFSYSRWSLAAVVVGLLIALLPWQRFRDGWPPVLLLAGVVVVMAVPAAIGIWSGIGTTERRTLWREVYQQFQTSPVFGLGSTSTTAGLPNAENQLVESAGQAGWFGIASVLVLVLAAAYAAWRSRRVDGKAGVAVVTTGAVVMGFAVLLPAAADRALPLGLVVLIAVIASSLGLLADPNPAGGVELAPEELSAGDADAGWSARGVLVTAAVVLIAAAIIALVL